MSYG
jgi:hypothetical protein